MMTVFYIARIVEYSDNFWLGIDNFPPPLFKMSQLTLRIIEILRASISSGIFLHLFLYHGTSKSGLFVLLVSYLVSFCCL